MHATHVFDTARLLPPARGGEDARISAVLEGVCAALEWVAQRRRPAVLRMPLDAPPLRAPVMTDPLERAVALVTSLWDPRTSYRAQRERIHTLWAAAETACAGRLWLAGYDCGARYPWGERCAALAGRTLAPPRRTVNLRHLALFARRTIPPTCPRQTSNLKRPRGVLDARPAITACDTPCAVAATLRCSADSSAVHSAEETGWSSYVTDGGFTGVSSWPFLALRCLIARPCRAVAGRPYVHATRCMIPPGGACP